MMEIKEPRLVWSSQECDDDVMVKHRRFGK